MPDTVLLARSELKSCACALDCGVGAGITFGRLRLPGNQCKMVNNFARFLLKTRSPAFSTLPFPRPWLWAWAMLTRVAAMMRTVLAVVLDIETGVLDTEAMLTCMAAVQRGRGAHARHRQDRQGLHQPRAVSCLQTPPPTLHSQKTRSCNRNAVCRASVWWLLRCVELEFGSAVLTSRAVLPGQADQGGGCEGRLRR